MPVLTTGVTVAGIVATSDIAEPRWGRAAQPDPDPHDTVGAEPERLRAANLHAAAFATARACLLGRSGRRDRASVPRQDEESTDGSAAVSARRHAGLVLAMVPLAVGPPSPAAAHDGAGATFTGRAGPYEVLAYDGVEGADRMDEYAVLLRERTSSAPVDGASVTVTAVPAEPDGVRAQPPVLAEGVGNVYRFALPSNGPAGWKVTVDVTGSYGAGRVSFAVHGPPSGSDVAVSGPRRGDPPLRAVAVGIGLLAGSLLGLPVLGYLRRSRRARRG